MNYLIEFDVHIEWILYLFCEKILFLDLMWENRKNEIFKE